MSNYEVIDLTDGESSATTTASTSSSTSSVVTTRTAAPLDDAILEHAYMEISSLLQRKNNEIASVNFLLIKNFIFLSS